MESSSVVHKSDDDYFPLKDQIVGNAPSVILCSPWTMQNGQQRCLAGLREAEGQFFLSLIEEY